MWDEVWLVGVLCLNGHDGELERHSHTHTKQDLVPDQLWRRRELVNRKQQPRCYGTDRWANKEHGEIVTRKVNEGSRYERGRDGGKHKGDDLDSRLSGALAFCLVEEGEVVGSGKEDDHYEEHCEACTDLGTTTEKVEGKHSSFALEELPGQEDDEQGGKLRG